MPIVKPRLAVMISGRGRNLQVLMNAVRDQRIPAELACVISSEPEAEGLIHARRAGIPCTVISPKDYADRAACDQAMADALNENVADIVALAGFMRVLGPAFVEEFKGHLLNIHPSLLPAYPGLHTHRRALADRASEHGASVHFVGNELDAGPVVIQGAISIAAQDNERTLAARVLEEVELRIYPQAVSWMARHLLALQDGVIHFRGEPLFSPLTLKDLEPEFL